MHAFLVKQVFPFLSIKILVYKRSFTFIISSQGEPIYHHPSQVINHESLYIKGFVLFVLNVSLWMTVSQ